MNNEFTEKYSKELTEYAWSIKLHPSWQLYHSCQWGSHVSGQHWLAVSDATSWFISLTLKKNGSSSDVVLIAWQCGLRPSVSSIILASSLLPLAVTVCCVVCNKLWILSSPFPLNQNALFKIGTNKLRGQLAVKDSPSFFLYKCLLLRSSFTLSQSTSLVCAFVQVCVGGHTLEEKWLWAALSMAIQSYTFSEVSLFDWNSSAGVIIQPAGVYVCACVCTHVREALQTLCERWERQLWDRWSKPSLAIFCVCVCAQRDGGG